MTGRAFSAAMLAMVAGFASVRGQQQSVFKSGVDVVFVDVSATRGRVPVRDLTSADFVLSDNGVRQQVEAVSMESVPIVLAAAPNDAGPATPTASVSANVPAEAVTTRRTKPGGRPSTRSTVSSHASSAPVASPSAVAAPNIFGRQ